MASVAVSRSSARRCLRVSARLRPTRRSTEKATASAFGLSPPSPRRPRLRQVRCRRIPQAPGDRRNPCLLRSSTIRSRSRWRLWRRAACCRCVAGALSLIKPRALSRSLIVLHSGRDQCVPDQECSMIDFRRSRTRRLARSQVPDVRDSEFTRLYSRPGMTARLRAR